MTRRRKRGPDFGAITASSVEDMDRIKEKLGFEPSKELPELATIRDGAGRRKTAHGYKEKFELAVAELQLAQSELELTRSAVVELAVLLHHVDAEIHRVLVARMDPDLAWHDLRQVCRVANEAIKAHQQLDWFREEYASVMEQGEVAGRPG